ncbi:MAG: hypothetical protein PHW56_09915 [Methanosarcinaceae archaeon]|nr:hypothetical protein [Methanosarcinaceae archaeon]
MNIRKIGFFVVLLLAAMLFVSGCAEETGEEMGEEMEDAEGVIEGELEEAGEEMGEELEYTEDEIGEYSPVINPDAFIEIIDNPYFPLIPGTTFVYEGESEDGLIRNEIFVTSETRLVMGVTTIVVRDRELEDDELVEETYDWYAQDKDGNVWYFGEDSKEYEDNKVVSTAGSWEAGVDGALPGILVKGNPRVGEIYRQEYREGVAEDMAEVISLDESVTVVYGSFDNCLKTREWNPLEPGQGENKYYAQGIGLLLEMEIGGDEQLELIEITTK